MKNSTIENVMVGNGASALYSAPIPSVSLFRCSALAVVTGSLNGTFQLQASNDMPPAGTMVSFTPTNWAGIVGATNNVTSAGVTLLPSTELSYYWIRVAWLPSSGTGTIDCNFFALGY